MIVFDTSFEDLYKFLLKIDSSFPVKLSDKCSIQQYVDKLISLGTLVIEKRNGEIVGIVGGYINDDNSKLAYISIVGVDSDYQKKGIASTLIKVFIDKCKEKKYKGVHLYTHKTNYSAITLYKKFMFKEIELIDERRKDDIHYVYYINN